MTDRSGRIVGGHGTHNRPWIVDDYDDPVSSRRRPSGTNTTSHTTAHPSRRRAAASSVPLSQHSGGADSVASGATESSYERYLAQRRAEAAALAPAAAGASTTVRRPVVVPRDPSMRRPVVVPRESTTAIPSLHRSHSLTQSTGAITTAAAPPIPTSARLRQRSVSDHETAHASRLQTRPVTYAAVENGRNSDSSVYIPSAASAASDGAISSRPTMDRPTGTEQATSSRDLRAKRLAQQRHDAHVPHADTMPLHFQAHDAAVEQYLRRSRVATDPGRSRTSREPAVTPRTDAPVPTTARPSPVVPRPTEARVRAAAPRAASATNHARSSSQPRPGPVVVPVISDASVYSALPASRAPVSSGWSTLPRASGSGHTTMTPHAMAQHEAYKAETAEAAKESEPMSSGCSKVDEYLAQRQALKQRASSFTRLGKKKQDIVAVSSESMATLTVAAVPSATVSFDESSVDESSETESDNDIETPVTSDFDHVSEDEADEKEWSVKVCVVSAVDFPASVVPNLPFSPLLKVGLIRMESTNVNPQEDAAARSVDDARCRELASLVERNGILSIPKSRVRCTNSKILSKRDNGSAEFHEEMRWDGVRRPEKLALAVELSSRAVLTPANIKESPPQQFVGPFQLPTSTQQSVGRGQSSLRSSNQSGNGETGLSSLFRKIRKSDSAEMEEANAAAAVAKLLVQGDDAETNHQQETTKPQSGNHQSEINVTLRRRKRKHSSKMTEEFRLGAKVIPLSRLPLANAMRGNDTVRIEQWFELDTAMKTVLTSLVGTSPSSSTATRNPSILLEISLSAPERLDDSEDDMGEADGKVESRASYSKRASMKIRNQLKQEIVPHVEKIEEPLLEPGIVDFICVVGARDIGDQKSDDGSSGWVDSTPECCILEQFPSKDEFHASNGRTAVLPGKVEWFCFPEGCKLWRGLTPPNADELNLKRFSATSASQYSTSIASFDACLGCTTSFAWFSISSNSDQYGSESKKTYGAVIRFYVPAPIGVDPTQDDFAQTVNETATEPSGRNGKRRLWVPIGICMTSSMPIVGQMEAMLLRLCESLSSTGVLSFTTAEQSKSIQEAIVSVIVSFQKPLGGIVNCSFPFLEGERLHISLPPRSGLPPLPHGGAVASVCRLLGADGVNYLFAAFLTECKILLHSDEVSNLSLVSEVMTALLYPFQWSLPCVPVLPVEMMEFLEAPVSFLLGVPSCNMQHVDPSILEDIVVVDLDRDFSSSDYFEGRRNGHKTKMPVPLPAAVASNISKAVYRLLRAEDEVDDSYGTTFVPGSRSFPRMEPESLPEREFRLAVAIEVCGLIRGFDECLVFSSSQPVFNVDKFLQVAPAIFEDQRILATSSHGQHAGQTSTRNMISPRSRRFVSLLVCCQHFHQFLDVLESESLAFFRLIMRSLQANYSKRDSSLSGMLRSLDGNDTVAELCKTLQSVEDKTPTYRVKSYGSQWPTIFEAEANVDAVKTLFPFDLLQQIRVDGDLLQREMGGAPGTKAVSVEYLVELQKNPWRYQKLLDLDDTSPSGILSFLAIEKVAIREAIGDRRYRAWKSGYFKFDSDETSVISEESKGRPTTLDLIDLVSSVQDDTNLAFDAISSTMQGAETGKSLKFSDVLLLSFESGRPDRTKYLLVSEGALQKKPAQAFFLAVLRQRIEKDAQKNGDNVTGRRRSLQAGGSKLDTSVFDVMIRLSFAMLDACQNNANYESAYSLLKMSAGLYAAIIEGDSEVNVVYLTERIGLHPVYADLKLWDMVYRSHSTTRQQNHTDKDSRESDKGIESNIEYEAAVATLYEMNGYGIPAEELARFAYRICRSNDWLHSEKGQSLLMLAKRVCIRRDHGPVAATPATMSDVDLMSPSPREIPKPKLESKSMNFEPDTTTWIEIGWCHPVAQSSRRAGTSEAGRRVNKPQPMKSEERVPTITNENTKYMRRSAVTCLAYLGSSVVVSGGLDGGVFIARRVRSSDKVDTKAENAHQCEIRGVHLDWGSSGSRYSVGSASTSLDGEYGVGAVTCLATTRSSTLSSKRPQKDVVDPLDDEAILEAMEGSRIVAGTTCGDLRVWSVKDVFSAVFYTNRGGSASTDASSFQRGAGGTSSTFASRSPRGTDFAAGSSLTRLKFSLRGRALSGHRGGVSCIDVHSNVYRPDSIVSGGADGLIKLWSLKTPGVSSARKVPVDQVHGGSSTSSQNVQTAAPNNGRGGDALSILSGHGGRVLCVKTAWHGDRLLSGGADRTVRMWDLAGSGGKCLSSLSGHFGWVTSVHYWGPNTIVSASTDRSLALWDVRVSNSPLFILRHHHAPVSDVLLGPRSDPVMISAAVDGSIAAWDFRLLASESLGNETNDHSTTSRIVRNPAGKLYTHQVRRSNHSIGPMHLNEGLNTRRKTAMCLGSDAIIREWDYQTGFIVNEYTTGHCDTISSFVAVGGDCVFGSQLESAGRETPTATISASWDGTIRMRSMVPHKR